jgi:hypothetical protein
MRRLSLQSRRAAVLSLALAGLGGCEAPMPASELPPEPSFDATTPPESDVAAPPESDVAAPPESDVTAPPAPDVAAPPAPDTSEPPGDLPPAEPDAAEPSLAPDATWLHPGHVSLEVGGAEEAPLAEPVPPAPPGTRPRRRLDIPMLDAAFKDALGGITWTVTSGSTTTNQWTLLAETLGVPNFIDTTIEDLNPTPLFTKFLGDGARKACGDRVAADKSALVAGASATSRPVLFGPLGLTDTPASAPEATDAQLSALLLRFHGRRLAPDAPGFDEWRWLLASSHQLTASMETAWQAVCVALLTHPDFYTL